MQSSIWRIGAVLLAAGLMAGCGGNEKMDPASSTATSSGTQSNNSGGGANSGKKVKLAFVTNGSSPFWVIARKGTDKAVAEDPNISVDFKIPSNATADEQKQIIDAELVNSVDGIAVSPIDPANETQMLNDAAKKTLLFTHDSDAPESDRACYVGTDNVAAGKQAGELVKKVLPDGGKIMVFVGKSDAQNAKERYQGLKDALKGSKVEVIDLRTDDTDRTRAKANVQDTLVKYPDIKGLVGLWSYNGPAILNAVKEAGKIGKVKIVCFDEEEDTLDGVKAGEIEGTVVQQPFEFGYQAITMMAKVIRGDKSVIPATKQKFVETRVIDKSNVDEFSSKLKELTK